uniref:Uncharacterized protein n=1 Tax=Inoviridae sp. ctPjN3 TaxID=2826761 RepID=A0A8S5NG96_9VIRU|nr:MAG TPA: hypothetical protein [Inoviridae sp. ctPjN3]
MIYRLVYNSKHQEIAHVAQVAPRTIRGKDVKYVKS